MEFDDFVVPFGKVGDAVGQATQWVVSNISKLGVNVTPLQSQIISILILGLGIYLVISLLKSVRKPIKWGLIILFIFLIVSVFAGIFT